MNDLIERLQREAHYSEDGGFDAEGNDLGSVDALIDYKNALEDALAAHMRQAARAIPVSELAAAIGLPDADEEGILPGSAADQCAAVYELLGRYGVTVA